MIRPLNTFKGKIFLSLWFLEELVGEEIGKAVLSEMSKILCAIEPSLVSV